MRRLLAAMLALAVAACAGGQTRTPGPSAAAVNAARAELRGAELEPTGRGTAANRALTAQAWARVQPAIAEMCAHFDASGCDYKLIWSEEDTPNAFADGEAIYMFDGLVRYLDNEAQIALVVAHEAAHNVADHPSRGARNTAVGVVAGAVLGGLLAATLGEDWTSEGIALGAAVGGTAGRLSYSKEYEREADYVGAYIIDHAGYDLADARGLYRVLGGLSGVRTTSILDSHPASPDRLAGYDAAGGETRRGSRWPQRRPEGRARRHGRAPGRARRRSAHRRVLNPRRRRRSHDSVSAVGSHAAARLSRFAPASVWKCSKRMRSGAA